MSAISEETNLPSTWRWVRCQDIIDVRDGTHDTPTKTNFGIPLITSKNLTPEGLDFSNITYISEEDHQSIEKRSAVDDGDVLFAMIGTIGNPVIVKKERRFSIKNIALFKLNKSLYYPPFFKELLNTSIIKKQLDRNTKGGNQKFVSLSVLRNMVIPLPPLEEQKRIAEILDQAEELRTKRREAIAQFDTLTQSIFLEMFGDPKSNPKNWSVKFMAALFATSPIFGTMIPPVTEKLGWLSLRVGNIQNWSLDLSDRKYVDLPPESIERHSVKDGDLLLARAIASQDHLGKCVVAHPCEENWAFDSHLMRLRFDRNLTEPEFIRHLFMTTGGRSLFLSASRKSTVQFNINTKEIAALRIPVPPIYLQQEFTRRIEAVEKLKASHRASLSELDALFDSLQHRAFKGDL